MKSSTQDKAEGTVKTVSGKAKEVTGKVLGKSRLEAEGKAEQVEGQTQKKIGDIKKVFGR